MSATIIYLSHGGGPLPLLGDRLHADMVRFLTELGPKLKKPKAIVVISAHWEQARPTCTANPQPPLIYDYYGFPPESYTIRYPSPGDRELAFRVASLLDEGCVDEQRGFDHGMYVPLKLLFPEPSIPTIQLSLLSSLSSEAHYHMGEQLKPLLDEDLLIIGSGFSFHNMQQFWKPDDQKNLAFQDYLFATCCNTDDEAARKAGLVYWEQAPFARYCHPREDHLLPLLVCQGMAGTQATCIFDGPILGRRSLAFQWGRS
jgi:aromatic ring-opening dioxygenase catalytic subunit (LigB family)